jgi:hypothetical protein
MHSLAFIDAASVKLNKFKMDGHERCVPKRPSFVNSLIAALADALMFVFNYFVCIPTAHKNGF